MRKGRGICVVIVSVVTLLVSSAATLHGKQPNIVFMMADDLGIGDVEVYGGNRCKIDTPALDSLATDGMKFMDAHAVASVCVPSRLGIMTGRYAWRFRSPRPNGEWGFLNPRIPVGHFTLGEMLRELGYRTGYIGKWHLGTLMQTTDGQNQGIDNVDYGQPLKIGPGDYGFDYSFILPGSLDMYPYVFARNGRFVGEVNTQKAWSAFNRLGPAASDFEDYKVLDTLAGEVEQFIERNSQSAREGKPFFLYFALTSPHTPTSPSPGFEGKSALGLYGDFVAETDHTMGRLLRALDKYELRENTLVIATSDHGAAPYAGNIRKAIKGNIHGLEERGHYSRGSYRGYKFSVYEGGLRIPLLVRWPGVVAPGTECNRLVGLNDLGATLADLCGYDRPEQVLPDSISFLPLLEEPEAEGIRKTLVMQSPLAFVVRHGKWKLALTPSSGAKGLWGNTPIPEEAWRSAVTEFGRQPTEKDLRRFPFVQLFDLESDVRETRNVAQEYPEVVEEILSLLDSQIANGRSTPGKSLKNDVDRVSIHARVPAFVLQ